MMSQAPRLVKRGGGNRGGRAYLGAGVRGGGTPDAAGTGRQGPFRSLFPPRVPDHQAPPAGAPQRCRNERPGVRSPALRGCPCAYGGWPWPSEARRRGWCPWPPYPRGTTAQPVSAAPSRTAVRTSAGARIALSSERVGRARCSCPFSSCSTGSDPRAFHSANAAALGLSAPAQPCAISRVDFARAPRNSCPFCQGGSRAPRHVGAPDTSAHDRSGSRPVVQPLRELTFPAQSPRGIELAGRHRTTVGPPALLHAPGGPPRGWSHAYPRRGR